MVYIANQDIYHSLQNNLCLMFELCGALQPYQDGLSLAMKCCQGLVKIICLMVYKWGYPSSIIHIGRCLLSDMEPPV